MKDKLSKAIDLITSAIDGRMGDEPELVEANEILCEILEGMDDDKLTQ